jgi:spermidine synthase
MQLRRAFVVLYTLSGSAALVYEVAWTRLLTLQLGHTVAAASTVLAAFMGGLAVGAVAVGQSSVVSRQSSVSSRQSSVHSRRSSCLRLYAALEVLVAVAALLLPFALRAAIPALAWAYDDGAAPARFAIVRVGISLILVGIPAAAMGATFPIAAGAMAKAAADAGVLYAANTAGAAAGAITAGFWLVPALGLRGTTWVGVALNLAAAAGALWLSTRTTAEPAARAPIQDARPKRKDHRAPRTPKPLATPAPLVACAAAAVSGFSALVYEVAWTRLLAMVIGPTTYAFATMAASFISGLALGSAAGTRLARRSARPGQWLALMLVAGAAAATATAWFAATRMPLVVAEQVADPSANFAAIVWRQALGVAVLLLPMTLALGAAFPLALAVAGGDGSTVARDAARVYTANTLGAIAGSLAAGFALVPALGLRETIRVAAAISLAAGGVVFFAERWRRSTRAGALDRSAKAVALPALSVTAALATILLVPPWDRALLSSGAYKYAPYLGAGDLAAVLRAGSLQYYKEGASGTVSVRDLTGTRSLSIDGKVDASNAGDMLTQRLLGLLPVLVHGHARQIAIIGLGSGVTVGSALAAGTVQRADVIEISPEVVEASRFFDRESGNALSQPGVRLIVGDGRSHLLLTPSRYDVIVSEPSNPWMAGVASLFTREFFEAARSRLAPGGLLCQWAHTYDIRPDDLRSIVRTFASVFPDSTMWLVGGGDLLLVGARDGDILSRLTNVEHGSRNGTVTRTLADVGIADGTTAFTLLSSFAGGPRDVARFTERAIVQTDDRTPLEYSAPRGIYGRTREDNAAAIRALTPDRPIAVTDVIARADDRAWAARGAMELKAQAFTAAYEAFREAVTRNSRNTVALAGLSDAAGGTNKLVEERDWLRAIAAREPANSAVRIELSRVLAVLGNGPGAVEAATEALRLAPDDARAAEQLASVFADSNDVQRLAPFADAMAQRFPDRAESHYYRATALYLSGKTEDAVIVARRAVDAQPSHARAQGLLAAACAALGRRDCAQAAFDASIRGNPRDPSGYVNAGVFQLQTANAGAAVGYFASALAIDPSSDAARSGLSQAQSLLAGR